MSYAVAQFPARVWDGLSYTLADRLDDKSPDYKTGDQMIAEIIATQEIVLTNMELVEPLQNIGPANSILAVNSDGLALQYKTLVAGTNVTIDDVDGVVTISSSGGGSAEDIDDRVAALLVAGTYVQLSYDDTANTLTVSAAHDHDSQYSPLNHTHTASEITDFAEAVDARVNGLFVAGTGIHLTYNDSSNTFTVAVSTITSDQISDFNTAVIAATSGTYSPIGHNHDGVYAKLAGLSGGQTLSGDRAVGGNLILQSTSSATKGKIFFGASSAYDEVNNRLGVGTSSPDTTLTIVGAARFGTGSVSGTQRHLEINEANAAFAMRDTNTGGHKWLFTNLSSGDGSIGIYDETIGAFRLLIDASGNVGIGTTPSFPLDINQTYNGRMAQFKQSSDSPTNAGGADCAGFFGADISANSTTNHVVHRTIQASFNNNLTGGGVVSNARCLDFATSTQTGTTTTELSHIYLGTGLTNGTVTTGIGIHIVGIQGNTKYGIRDDSGGTWYNAFGPVAIGTGAFYKLSVGGNIHTNSREIISAQGAHLCWNRNLGDGATWLINQKGAGTGGLYFGEASTTDVFVEYCRMTASGLSINGGNFISKVVTGAASWAAGTVANGASVVKSFAVSGVSVGDHVVAAVSSTLGLGWILSAYVTSSGNIGVTLLNQTGSSVTLGTITVYAMVFKR